MPKNKRLALGFSLVELSIVIVIIGLIVSAVFVGKELIDASKIINARKEAENYASATRVFKDKYEGLPGDLRTAAEYLGAPAISGDGDNILEFIGLIGQPTPVNYLTAPFNDHEMSQFWVHLAQANLIAGQYTESELPGVGMPAFSYDESVGYKLSYYQHALDSSGTRGLPMSTLSFILPGRWSLFGFQASVTPETMQKLDTKFDDGKGGSGLIIDASPPAPYFCHDVNGQYNFQFTYKNCIPVFLYGL
jgi:prepilin-type N-terminal cleavage/methylation domain-containing protein